MRTWSGDRTAQFPESSTRGEPDGLPDRLVRHLSDVERGLQDVCHELVATWDGTSGHAGWAKMAELPGLITELVASGGKRIRPTMVFLGWAAADVTGSRTGHDQMHRAAVALELLHTFALVHDDVMDRSPTRRGRATAHVRAQAFHDNASGLSGSERFGDDIAIMAGDLAHAQAEQLAAELPATMRSVWRRMVLELLTGQVGDVVGAAAGDRSVDFARFVARRKTGMYTVARPLQLGAVAASAGPDALRALDEYGRHAGDAFALRDDVLGVIGDPGRTGKPVDDDLRSGKPTTLLALAAERLDGPARAALARAGTPALSEEDVATVRIALRSGHVIDEAEAMIDQHVDRALLALDTRHLSPDGAAELARTAARLAHRER